MQESAHSVLEMTSAGVATVTIANAGPMNLMNSKVMLDLTAVLRTLRRDPQLRVLVLRGSGEKSFIGGADIHEMAALEPASAERFITVLHDLVETVRDFPAPVIGRMSGWCIGAGLELAAACDIRVAAESARFSMPEVKIGIPSVIQAVLLSRLIGEGNTRLLLLTARVIDAPTALRWGLVNEVTPADMLDAAIAGIVAEILGCGPRGIRMQKQLLRDWESPDIAELMGRSIKAFGASFDSDEPTRLMNEFVNRKRS